MSETFLYYLFAKEFGWTPAQVDEIDEALLRELQIVVDEMKREEERQMKRANKK